MTLRRRVVFVAPSAYPLGGVATWLDEVAAGLPALGWDVTVALTGGRFHVPDAYLRAHPLLDVWIVRGRTGSAVDRVEALSGMLLERRPDVAAGVNVADLYPAVQRLRAGGALPGTRCVATLHGLEGDYYADLVRYGAVIDAAVCTNRLACWMAIASAALPARRVLYAPYGVPIGSPRARTGPPRLLWAGRLEQPQKRVLDLGVVATGLRGTPWTIDVAGSGPEEASLRELLAPDIAAGRVRMLGTVNRAAMSRLHEEATALLVTSSWETGPIVAWEAMAAGAVLVTSDYMGSRAEGSLRPGENCLGFPVGRPEQAVSAIRSLEDPDLRGRLAREGHRLVQERYSREASLHAWRAALEAVLELDPLPVPRAPDLGRHGRLDRWLGPSAGERVRRLLRRSARHDDPGSEWPHSHSPPVAPEEFLSSCARVEAERA